MSASDLCTRRKALQGFRLPKSLVDMSPVLHFLLVGEKIQSTFSTAMDLFFLKWRGREAETQKNVINKWLYGRLIADMFHLDLLKECNKYEID